MRVRVRVRVRVIVNKLCIPEGFSKSCSIASSTPFPAAT